MYAAEDGKYLLDQNERLDMISSIERCKTQPIAKPTDGVTIVTLASAPFTSAGMPGLLFWIHDIFLTS